MGQSSAMGSMDGLAQALPLFLLAILFFLFGEEPGLCWSHGDGGWNEGFASVIG